MNYEFNEKPIKGFEGYKINNGGLVMDSKGTLSQHKNPRGGWFVYLRKNGKNYMKSISRLVAEHFLEDTRKYPSDVVGYKDGNNTNFHVSNLYWTSRADAYKKLYNKENRYSELRLSRLRQKLGRPVRMYRIEEDGTMYSRQFNTMTDAANFIGVSCASIRSALKNPNYMCGGHRWEYIDKEGK